MAKEEPTYFGQPANQGRLVPLEPGASEGYAVLKCGNTEVVLSYTMLHAMRLEVNKDHLAAVDKAQKALQAITCEASLGRTA